MENVIEHANIFYIRDFSELGGVETFTYEMAKKFKDLDIAVVYKSAHKNQLKRVRKFCRAYLHTNQRIKCKVAIINYDVSIIDFIDEGADIYQVVHGDYENPAYTWKPPTHPRIKQYIGITKYIVESFKRITGNQNVILGYNPLTIEKEKKLVLLSATRLSRIKGKDRMEKLVKALDNAGINYIWYVFTNDTNAIPSPNVIYMKPRLDVGWWFDQADYIVQLSDTEGCSYTINEALYRNIPVIVTPLPYLKEIGVEDGKNAYIMNFDCKNIDDIVAKIENVPKFEFKKLEDNYINLLAKSKSYYKEEEEMNVKVRCIKTTGYNDMELGRHINFGEEYVVDRDRAEYLKSHCAVEILTQKVVEEKPKSEDLKVDPYEGFEIKENNEIKPAKKTTKKTSKKK